MSLRNRVRDRFLTPIDVQGRVPAPPDDDDRALRLAIINEWLTDEGAKPVRDEHVIDYLLDRRSAVMSTRVRYPVPVIPGGAS